MFKGAAPIHQFNDKVYLLSSSTSVSFPISVFIATLCGWLRHVDHRWDWFESTL